MESERAEIRKNKSELLTSQYGHPTAKPRMETETNLSKCFNRLNDLDECRREKKTSRELCATVWHIVIPIGAPSHSATTSRPSIGRGKPEK